MRLALVGLGNPGKTYSKTRHNIGHLFIDYYAKRAKIDLLPGKGEFLYGATEELLLAKILTYMNLSGVALKQFVDYFKISPDSLFVCHDDLDMLPFTVKVKFDGGSGGHRGIESCVLHLNTEDFYRVKFGIGKPENIDPRDYVLSNLSNDELINFEQTFNIAYEGFNIMIREGIQKGITYINTFGKGSNG
ncbi:MAG: aminoacyl-tRNA hydrolase [candidate division WOR-3 bacterium]